MKLISYKEALKMGKEKIGEMLIPVKFDVRIVNWKLLDAPDT